MAYAHAKPGEHCTKCNDLAVRVVGTQPLCLDHFTILIDHCEKSLAQRILTPPSNPAEFDGWADRLKRGIEDGHITVTDARHAWEHARTAA